MDTSVPERKAFECGATSNGCEWYHPQKCSARVASSESRSPIMYAVTSAESVSTDVSVPSTGSGNASVTSSVVALRGSGRPWMKPITSTGMRFAARRPFSTPAAACDDIVIAADAEMTTVLKYVGSLSHGCAGAAIGGGARGRGARAGARAECANIARARRARRRGPAAAAPPAAPPAAGGPGGD